MWSAYVKCTAIIHAKKFHIRLNCIERQQPHIWYLLSIGRVKRMKSHCQRFDKERWARLSGSDSMRIWVYEQCEWNWTRFYRNGFFQSSCFSLYVTLIKSRFQNSTTIFKNKKIQWIKREKNVHFEVWCFVFADKNLYFLQSGGIQRASICGAWFNQLYACIWKRICGKSSRFEPIFLTGFDGEGNSFSVQLFALQTQKQTDAAIFRL